MTPHLHFVSSGLSKLQRLNKLSLNGNRLSSLDDSALDQLPQLVFLSVENNRIASLHGIQRACSLHELYVCNNQVSMSKDIYCLKVRKRCCSFVVCFASLSCNAGLSGRNWRASSSWTSLGILWRKQKIIASTSCSTYLHSKPWMAPQWSARTRRISHMCHCPVIVMEYLLMFSVGASRV